MVGAWPAAPTPAQPQARPEFSDSPAVRGMDVQEHRGLPLPMELEFTDSEGRLAHLGDYFKTDGADATPAGRGRPAIVLMVYYDCPLVCTAVMDNLARHMGNLDYTVGQEYNALVFSFDPTNTTPMAAEKSEFYLSTYPKGAGAAVAEGWRFHTGTAESAKGLAGALGFPYRLQPNGEYSHPIMLFVVTPEGRISEYFYGFGYDAADLRLALLEASEGTIAKGVGDRLMMFCYGYDPLRGGYTLQAFRVMQVGGVLTMLALGGLVVVLKIGERHRRRAKGLGRHEGPTAPAGMVS